MTLTCVGVGRLVLRRKGNHGIKMLFYALMNERLFKIIPKNETMNDNVYSLPKE